MLVPYKVVETKFNENVIKIYKGGGQVETVNVKRLRKIEEVEEGTRCCISRKFFLKIKTKPKGFVRYEGV